MADPEARRLLYALVAGAMVATVVVLVIGAVPVAPPWWTALTAAACLAAALVVAVAWRRTGVVLAVGLGLFVAWTVGTLVVTV